jgi:hypothetical protein
MIIRFDVTQKDIAKLKDDDLRDLIGRLCKAELRRNGHSSAPVAYGGHQDAPDGGVDVSVRATTLNYQDGYIKTPITFFQVKVPAMTKDKIEKEMCPKGVLLPSIHSLEALGGMYIIVSSKANITESVYKDRIQTMMDALGSINCGVEYYDGGRIANWVNDYPAYIFWVKQKIGEPLQGWEPYGNWARVPEKVPNSYLVDEGILLTHAGRDEKEYRGKDAVLHVRGILGSKANSVRLVGISGVGKTRFVQALFEEGVGDQPLNRDTAFYTDWTRAPVPSPGDLLNSLQLDDQEAILIVDNCSAAIHKQLTAQLQARAGKISLITIEYDIREGDVPEGSTALKLEPGSEELVIEVLGRLLPHLSQLSCRRIAKTALGNFKAAKAIGEGVTRGEDVSSLNDDELFDRIFHQKKRENEGLLEAAELLSLVYSFDRRDGKGEPELKVLAKLGEIKARRLKRSVSGLVTRNTVQERGHWGALLPPAIANRFAERSLDYYSVSDLNACFLLPGRRRLLKSFANRLGYLPDNKSGKAVVDSWLAEGGILYDVKQFDRPLFGVLRDAAIVCEEVVLARIEAWTYSDVDRQWIISNFWKDTILQVAVYLGYRAELLERVVEVLLKWYEVEEVDNEQSNHFRRLKVFFQPYLSGTQSGPEERSAYLLGLVERYSADKDLVEQLLKGAFRVHSLMGHQRYHEVKGRSDYGYQPKTVTEESTWYGIHLELLRKLLKQNDQIGKVAREIFDLKFHDLYRRQLIRGKVMSVVEELGDWPTGWLVVDRSLKAFGDKLPEELKAELNTLKIRLAPAGLQDQIDTYLLFKRGHPHQLMGALAKDDQIGIHDLEEMGELLGEQVVASNEMILYAFIGLLKTHNPHTSHSFGSAVGKVLPTSDFFSLVKEVLRKLSFEDIIHYQSLQSLSSEIFVRDKSGYHAYIEGLLKDDELRRHVLPLQLSHAQDGKDVERLDRLIGADFVFGNHYRYLGEWLSSIPDDTAAGYLTRVNRLEGGNKWALDVAHERLRGCEDVSVLSDLLIDAVIGVAADFAFSLERANRRPMESLYLDKIVKVVFEDDRSFPVAIDMLKTIKETFDRRLTISDVAESLIRSIACSQPTAVLDIFVANVSIEDQWDSGDCFPNQMRPCITKLPLEAIRQWLLKDITARGRLLAYCITPFSTQWREGALESWYPVASLLLEMVDDADEIFHWFHDSFRSSTSVGQGAAESMEACLPLLSKFVSHRKPKVWLWAVKEIEFLEEEIKAAIELDKGFWSTEEAEPSFE